MKGEAVKLPKGATPEGFLGGRKCVRKVGRKIAKVVEDVNIYIYIYICRLSGIIVLRYCKYTSVFTYIYI